MAIGLPLLFTVSYIKIPAPAFDDIQQSKTPLPQIRGSLENEQFKFQLRSDGEKDQLEVIIKKPLAQPAAFLYGPDQLFIGKLGPKGVYRFDIKERVTSSVMDIAITDPIKKTTSNFEISL